MLANGFNPQAAAPRPSLFNIYTNMIKKKCFSIYIYGTVLKTEIAQGKVLSQLLFNIYIHVVTADIIAHQVLLNRVPEQATEDRVSYQIYY